MSADRRPSPESGRPHPRKADKKAYPVAQPFNPPPGLQRPLPVPPYSTNPVAPSPPSDLVFSIDDPPLPVPSGDRNPAFLTPSIKVGLVAIVVLLCLGAGVFVLGPRKRHAVKASATAIQVAPVDPAENVPAADGRPHSLTFDSSKE